MKSEPTDWIAPAGVRAVDPDATHTMIPTGQMEAAGLSFTAWGLYSELLTYQGAPMDPYGRSIDPDDEIFAAVVELIQHGFAVRVPRPLIAED